MSSRGADLFLHPVRMRILEAFFGGRLRTAGELINLLPDIPQATLYRHLGALVEAGVLRVRRENRIRGTVEGVYGLGPANPLHQDPATMSPEDHLKHFVAFLSGLAADFTRHLGAPGADIRRDGVGYRYVTLSLSDDELAELVSRIDTLIEEARRPRLDPVRRRRRRLYATILMPQHRAGASAGHPWERPFPTPPRP